MSSYQPDYIINEKTGFLALSDQDLAAKLDLLLAQPDLRRSMSEAAIVHARQFDWDIATGQWQDAFEGVLASRRSH
jgi:glycosyltransferase involved in cell wall biosynthesis